MTTPRHDPPDLQVRLPLVGQQAHSSSQHRQHPHSATGDLPPISALFLVDFDVKAGYTVSWKRSSSSSLELEGVVEYKSLPSGLHMVPDDLVYFVHPGGFAGLSAFINAPCDDETARNARMLAVGVLVPLSYGRLGRAWRHAEGLQKLAVGLIDDRDTTTLEKYWEVHGKENEEEEEEGERQAASRQRTASDGTGLLSAGLLSSGLPPSGSGHKLSTLHPARSLKALLDTLGPLIFPVHRAALLRKRILISCHAPVEQVCNFVYDLSILSNIPLSTYESLSPRCAWHRLRPLFTVGVHDIPFLFDLSKTADYDGSGWIACTTDSILASKDTLWDMLITLPPSHATAAKEHIWPTVQCSHGTIIKATQRDMRRFRNLNIALSRLTTTAAATSTSAMSSSSHTPRRSSSPPCTSTSRSPIQDLHLEPDNIDKLVESQSWTALTYNGFMWWATAGDSARSDEADESAHDVSLLADFLSPGMPSMPEPSDPSATTARATGPPNRGRRTSSSMASGNLGPDDESVTELALIAYFHRLTSQLLTKLAEAVKENSQTQSEYNDEDEEDEDPDDRRILIEEPEGDEEQVALLRRRPRRRDNEEALDRGNSQDDVGEDDEEVLIGSDALKMMGLDMWSESGAEFSRALAEAYLGRKVVVEGKGVELCGVKVC